MQTDSICLNDDKLSNIIRGLSQARLTKYGKISPNNLYQQIDLYIWNSKLSETLYIPIQGLEIITRNYFSLKLSNTSDKWWENFNFIHPQIKLIHNAIDTLKENKKLINKDNIVSSLSFGFWTGLLNSKYENSLWRPYLHHIFANISQPLLRKNIHQEFNAIRMLRNRIAHHECILRPDLPNHYFRIIKMINWFCKDTATWIESQNNFIEVWHQPINPFINQKAPETVPLK